MKRSLFALAAGLLVASVSLAAQAVTSAWDYSVSAVKAVVFGPAPVVAADVAEPANSTPRVALRRAGQFVLRVLKRERPEVTPDWRMVPST